MCIRIVSQIQIRNKKEVNRHDLTVLTVKLRLQKNTLFFIWENKLKNQVLNICNM